MVFDLRHQVLDVFLIYHLVRRVEKGLYNIVQIVLHVDVRLKLQVRLIRIFLHNINVIIVEPYTIVFSCRL